MAPLQSTKNIPGIKTPPDKMIYLNKNLYGTLDAGNLWRKTVEELLISDGYTQAINDPCLFYKTRTDSKTYKTYIAMWVDDLLIVSNDPQAKNMKKEFESKGFEISHFDNINKYLGVNVNYDKDNDILTFDQMTYDYGIKHLQCTIFNAKRRISEAKDLSMVTHNRKSLTKNVYMQQHYSTIYSNFRVPCRVRTQALVLTQH